MSDLNNDDGGEHNEAMENILAAGSLVLDEEGRCFQEWEQTASHKNSVLCLQDWLSDQEQRGKVIYDSSKKISELENRLKKYGMPKEDRKWLYLVFNSCSSTMVSDDIDFYDPKFKSVKDKEKKMKNCEGVIARKICRKNNVRLCRLQDY